MSDQDQGGSADDSSGSLRARAPRKNLLLTATIRSGGVAAPVRIRNLSEKGAMVDGQALPEPGASLILQRLEVEMRGVVAWRAEGRCGIQFEGAASVDEWVAGRRAPAAIFGQGQSRVDQIQAAIRGGRDIVEEVAPARPTELITDVEARVAEELDHVQQMLDDVAGDLIGDMALLQRHGEALQRFDNACQILNQLSAILKAKDRAAAIAEVNLEALRDRLLHKPDG
ncbi:MAG TPA: PilZ domain-containing protein [Sphingomonas sp.]|nr:PilZ domain-containing protein [Sphingomonas sp.]